jgi:drug/metabolite transporter (DMT)-like permease
MPADVCIANIGPRERRRRFRLGVVGLVAGVALLAADGLASSTPLLLAAAAAAFFAGFSGIFQARGST